MTWSPGETEGAKRRVSVRQNKLLISKRIIANINQTSSSEFFRGEDFSSQSYSYVNRALLGHPRLLALKKCTKVQVNN